MSNGVRWRARTAVKAPVSSRYNRGMPSLVEISHVSKVYPGASAPALDDVSLCVEPGEVLGLVGPNGAGKSTLLGILLGLIPRDSGSVQIAGHDLDRERSALRRVCGLAPQELGFYPSLTVTENLAFYAGVAGLGGELRRQRMQFAIEAVHLQGYLGLRSARLSGGLKRRLNLALSLLHAPRILLLDEPTVGVDTQSRRCILQVIRDLCSQGQTVIYTSHYLDELEQICDRLAVIDQGRILREGRLADLLGEADQTLRIGLRRPPRDAQRSALVNQFGADLVFDAQGLQLRTRQPLEALDSLRAQGLELRTIQYGEGRLEDLLLRLSTAAAAP